MSENRIEYELIEVDEPQIIFLPWYMGDRVAELLSKHSIPCEIIEMKDFEDDWPGCYTFRGKTRSRGTIAVKAPVDSDNLIFIAENYL